MAVSCEVVASTERQRDSDSPLVISLPLSALFVLSMALD